MILMHVLFYFRPPCKRTIITWLHNWPARLAFILSCFNTFFLFFSLTLSRRPTLWLRWPNRAQRIHWCLTVISLRMRWVSLLCFLQFDFMLVWLWRSICHTERAQCFLIHLTQSLDFISKAFCPWADRPRWGWGGERHLHHPRGQFPAGGRRGLEGNQLHAQHRLSGLG